MDGEFSLDFDGLDGGVTGRRSVCFNVCGVFDLDGENLRSERGSSKSVD